MHSAGAVRESNWLLLRHVLAHQQLDALERTLEPAIQQPADQHHAPHEERATCIRTCPKVGWLRRCCDAQCADRPRSYCPRYSPGRSPELASYAKLGLRFTPWPNQDAPPTA